MKKIFSSFTLNETTRRVVTYLMYAAFLIYTVMKLIEEPSAAGKTAYGLILLVILGVAVWAEYLRVLYYKMIKELSMECNPSGAKHYYHLLQKRDFLKSYRYTLMIFDTLYYQDINQPAKCIEIVDNNEKAFRSSLDYLLIRNYTYFYSYYKLGNRTKVKKYYPEVMMMKDKKVKGTKVSPLYNWEFIEAIYLLCDKDYKKAIAAFANINPKNMNNRELSQYYTEFGKAYMEVKDKENAIIMLTKAVETAKQLSYAKEAKQCLQKL